MGAINKERKDLLLRVTELEFQLKAQKEETAELKKANKQLLKKKEIEEMQTKFSDAFENLANKIFEEKSSKFTEKNRVNLDEILKPLKEKIMELRK